MFTFVINVFLFVPVNKCEHGQLYDYALKLLLFYFSITSDLFSLFLLPLFSVYFVINVIFRDFIGEFMFKAYF